MMRCVACKYANRKFGNDRADFNAEHGQQHCCRTARGTGSIFRMHSTGQRKSSTPISTCNLQTMTACPGSLHRLAKHCDRLRKDSTRVQVPTRMTMTMDAARFRFSAYVSDEDSAQLIGPRLCMDLSLFACDSIFPTRQG